MLSWPAIGRNCAGSRFVRGHAALLLALIVPMPALVLVSGCGSSDNGVTAKTASQILTATKTAAQSASSVHVVAQSKIVHGVSFKVDARLAKNHGRAQISVLGFSFAVIRDGDTLYVRGNQAFVANLGNALGARIPANTWLKGPTTGPFGENGSFTDIERELPLMLSGSGPVTKGASVKIDGQPAVTLKETRRLYTGTLYVATTGQPYPLKLTKTGRETGQATFTNWNDPVNVTPPSNAIDIGQLQHTKKGH